METGFRSGVPLTHLGISLHWLFLHSATPFKLPMYPFLILNRWPRPTSAEKSSGMNTLKFCAYLPLTSASAASSPVLPSLILLPGGLCLMGHSPHSWTCVLRFIFKIISSVIFLKKKKKECAQVSPIFAKISSLSYPVLLLCREDSPAPTPGAP